MRRVAAVAAALSLLCAALPAFAIVSDQVVDHAGDSYGPADLLGVSLATAFEETQVGDGVVRTPTALTIHIRTSAQPRADGPTLLYRLRFESDDCSSIIDAAVRGPASSPTDPAMGEVRWRGLSNTCPQGNSGVTDSEWTSTIVSDGLVVALPFESMTSQDLEILGPGRVIGNPSASVRVLMGPSSALALDETAQGADFEVGSDVPADVPCTEGCEGASPPPPAPMPGLQRGTPYEMRGPGWISMEVQSDGPDVGFVFHTDRAEAPMQVSGFSYTSDTEEFTGSFTLGLYGSSFYEPTFESRAVVADAPVFEEGLYTRTHGSEFTSDPSMGAGGEPFTTKLVMSMTAARLSRWTLLVEDDPGIHILDYEVGSDVRLYVNKDFSAAANASSDAGVAGAALVGGEKRFEVDDTLLGAFSPVSTLGARAYDLSVSTPEGDQDCELKVGGGAEESCSFSDFTGGLRYGPGSYTFKATGAGAGPFGWANVMLFVMDARLPR